MLRALEYVIRATDKTGQAFSSVDRRLATSERLVKGISRALAGAFTTAAVLRFADSIGRVVKEAASLVDVADKVGLTVENLQKLQYAAEQNGVATNTLNMAMQRFSRRIGEASGNFGELLPVLKANNFAIRDQAGNVRPLIDLLGDYAELIKNAGSDQEALTLAFKAFDSEGAAVVNALRDGRDGLLKYMEEAENLGVVTDENARLAKEFDDRMTDLSMSLSNTYRNAVIDALRATDSLGDSISNVMDQLGRAIGGDREFATFQLLQKLKYPEFNDQAGDIAAAREIQMLRNGVVNRSGKGDRAPRTILPDPQAEKNSRQAAAAATKHAEAVDKLVTGLQLERELIGATATEQRVMNSLRQVDVDLMSEQGQKIAQLIRENDALTASYDAAESRIDFFAHTAFDAVDGLIDRTATLQDLFLDLAGAIAKAALQAALLGQGPLAGPGLQQGGGLFGSLFRGLFNSGGGATGAPLNLLPGMASGGGGRTGSDTQLFMARTKPGEPYAFGDAAINGLGGGGSRQVVNVYNESGNTKIERRESRIGNTEVVDLFVTEMDSRLSDGRAGRGLIRRIGQDVKPVRR